MNIGFWKIRITSVCGTETTIVIGTEQQAKKWALAEVKSYSAIHHNVEFIGSQLPFGDVSAVKCKLLNITDI